MPIARLRRYRHFPTVPDALALVMLLRLTAIAFYQGLAEAKKACFKQVR